MLSVSTAVAFLIRSGFDSSCDRRMFELPNYKRFQSPVKLTPKVVKAVNPLSFMKSKLVLLVSHELSLSGNMISFYQLFCLMV